MYQKLETQELMKLSLEKVKEHKKEVLEQKIALAARGKNRSQEQQKLLDETALYLVDIDEVIEKKEAETTEKKEAETTEKKEDKSYVVKAGTEKLVHLLLVRGRRFNPNTGKEESEPFIQMFTFSEWSLFKKHYSRLGYVVVDVLHDPYGDASTLVTA